MKATTLLLALLFFAFASCNHAPSKNTDQQTATPKPLQDDNIDDSSIKSSRGATLLSDIYNDQVKKQPELQNLENLMDHFHEGMPDSLKNFQGYDNKSTLYYRSANDALLNMGDTVLRERLRALINESKHKYLDTVKRFSVLMAHIDSNKIKIGDYHTL